MRTLRLLTVAAVLAWGAAAFADIPSQHYTTKTKTATAGAVTTDSVIWTPASGLSIVLQGCFFSTNGSNKIELESANVDVIPPQYFESAGSREVSGGYAPLWSGAADATLAWSTSTAAEASILCWGYEDRL